jgi:glyoxylase-like metal-dependent hydrolase (beta-lactamase superfamily II)
MSHWEDFITLNLLMVVARDGDNTIVINTGPPADLLPLNTLWKGFHPSGKVQLHREESERPVNALASIGVKPEDVTHLVVTPLVAYADANIGLFPNAQIVFSRRGWIEDIMAPPLPVHIPKDIFMPPETMKFVLFDAWDRVRLLDDGEVCPGINVWWAGTHHRSSLAVVIDSNEGTVIASDSFFQYGNVEGMHYLGVGESYAEGMVAYARVNREAEHIIPLYDGAVFERYLGGVVSR